MSFSGSITPSPSPSTLDGEPLSGQTRRNPSPDSSFSNSSISSSSNSSSRQMKRQRLNVPSSSEDVREKPSLEDLIVLVREGKNYSEAAAAAKEGILNENVAVGRLAIDLFLALFIIGQGYKEALSGVQEGFKSSNIDVRRRAIYVYQEMVACKQNCQEALAAARLGILDDNFSIHLASLDLLGELVSEGYGYSDALEYAREWGDDTHPGIRSGVLTLFEELVRKGENYREALAAALESNECSGIICNKSLRVFQALVEKGRNFEMAFIAAQKRIADEDVDVRSSALGVFKALVEQEQSYDEALVAARGLVDDEDREARVEALGVFKALIEKKQTHAYELAFSAAQGAVQDDNVKSVSAALLRSAALDLFTALVKLEQNYNEALSAAQVGIKDEVEDVQASALMLFEVLLKQGDKIAVNTKKVIDQIQLPLPTNAHYSAIKNLKDLRESYEVGEALISFDPFSLVTDYVLLSEDTAKEPPSR